MDIRFSNAARRGLKAMPAKDQAAMVTKLIRYADTGEGDVVKLTDQTGYRLRHGNWRAVFELIDGIYVVKIAHRREVYR
ncbi:type II toxin-antitoxin system RelE family toxin [Jiella mangrovi]|uniref:Type II toxin-antitoxin system RelE/ParE family toxin n=1 Tax=Jiella mangrovi TaxID=2821407 RepID=A0ABS4BIT6_9HYPH|nr:type II toxin-antitoxin system RelE/ParE family toxin [Jiella mangrovi]MBP0616679.1 type II toxin-antitoxin system RelE/ParE family toxin [Jiella mangrovi]